MGAVLAFPTIEDDLYALHKIFVDPDHRGSGVGKALLQKMVVELEGKKKQSFLTVRPDNKAALALYKSLGYSEKELVKGYYREHEDRLILKLSLIHI